MWQQVGDMAYYHFSDLSAQANLVNAVFTRRGGVSQGPYASLNAGLSVGDDRAAVIENRRRTAAALGLEPRDLVGAQQVHGDRVALVVGEGRPHPIPGPSPLRLRQKGEGSADSPFPATLERERGGEAGDASGASGAIDAVVVRSSADGERGQPPIDGVDALITACGGAMLAMRFADCVPVLLYDTVHQAVGLAHAGWQGSAAGIAGRTVQAMTQAFGTRPQDLLAGIGPSIGRCCYEVGQPVIQHFSARFPWWREVVTDHAGSLYLDLWAANRRQLLDAGLPAEQVAVAGICTACHPEDFYSHRREHRHGQHGQHGQNGQGVGVTGRFTAVIGLRA
jgi:YfiH family protein